MNLEMNLTKRLHSKSKNISEQGEHKDALGRPLKVGDFVAYPLNNTLVLGIIIKCNRKMVKISRIGQRRAYSSEKNRYSKDVVLLEGPDVSLYILKHSDA